jgi:hypothetical protein
MDPEGSLLCSKKPANCPYSEPDVTSGGLLCTKSKKSVGRKNIRKAFLTFITDFHNCSFIFYNM